MVTRSIYVAVPLLFLLAVVESAVLYRFPIGGHTPQLVALAAIGWGTRTLNPNEGLMWAFVGGLALDLFSAGPMGLSSLTLMAATAAAISLVFILPESKYILPVLVGGAATAVYLFLYAVLAPLGGFTMPWIFFQTLPQFIFVQTVAMSGIFWLLGLLEQRLYPSRVESF